MRPWVLAETNYEHTKRHTYEVAVLPLGATEPHNLHLPYGMDLFEGTIVGEEICEAAHKRGANVVLLPTIPFGTQTNMYAMPLAMNLNPTTLALVVTDLVESLVKSGVRKILLLNSHGGNEVKMILRELSGKTPAQLFVCNWYKAFADEYANIFDHPDDHAGEMETSFAMAFFPGADQPQAGRFVGGGRRNGCAAPVRGVAGGLGFDNASVAPVDDECGSGISARSHGGEGSPHDGSVDPAFGDVSR